MKISNLETERRNKNSMAIDRVDTLEMVKIINQEDQKVALAVEKATDQIAQAIELATERFNQGGRLIYVGAGTSGRLGVLDATELTPTYSVPKERAFGLIAGGQEAMFKAVEGAEDSKDLAIEELTKVNLAPEDILIALAASGRTPYTISDLEYGNQIGALTISITCTSNNEMSAIAQVPIEVIVGPEVVTGSTRMKAGTAQKMVLNMLSTGIMIKTGKVYQNLMINVQATNQKLVERSLNILTEALEISHEQASDLFEQAGQKVNTAIVMYYQHLTRQQAEDFLIKNNGRIISKG